MKQYFATESDCYKAGRPMVPRGVMLHSTGANNPNLRRYVGPDDGLLGENLYGNHWNQPGLQVCVHGFLGRLAEGSLAGYQLVPYTMRSWHAGGSANNTHISLELCEDDLQDEAYFRAIFALAVEEVAAICREFRLDPLADGVLVDHAEGHRRGIASNHADVEHWFGRFGESMGSFRQAVARAMGREQDTVAVQLPLLGRGDIGDSVRRMQVLLQSHGSDLAPYGADGDFGPVTDWEVRTFQSRMGLPPDGLVGRDTWTALLTK
jgi:N-acetylmuramoyl-L-alanine amidase